MIRAALTAIARRVIRQETFETLVAPALADLHFEAASGRPLARHYAGLPLVIAIALLRDFRIDISLTFSAHRVWKRAAAWYAGFVVSFVTLVVRYEMPWHLLDDTGRVAVLAKAVVNGLVVAIPFAMVAVAFYLRRGNVVPHRTITIAVMAFVVFASATQIGTASVLPALNRAVLDSVSRVTSQGRPGAGLDDNTRYSHQWQTWLDGVRERSSTSRSFPDVVGDTAVRIAPGYALNLIPYMMFGLVLARGRGWTVFFRAIGLVVTYFAVGMLAIQITIGLFGPSSPSYAAFRQLVENFFTAGLWLFGLRVFLLPLVPIYALTHARRLVRRSSSLSD